MKISRYLGEMYKYGKGVKRSYKKSKKFYNKSIQIFKDKCEYKLSGKARVKDATPYIELSETYRYGIGISINVGKYVKYYYIDACKIDENYCEDF